MSRLIVVLGSVTLAAGLLGGAAYLQLSRSAFASSPAPVPSLASVFVHPAKPTKPAVTVIPEVTVTPQFVLLPEILVEGRLARAQPRVKMPTLPRAVAALH